MSRLSPEEFAALPEAKASVAVTLERLDIHANLTGAPVTLATTDGLIFKLPSHLQEAAKRIVASRATIIGKRGRLPKLFAELDLATLPLDQVSSPGSSSRDALLVAVVESISSRLEANGAYEALVDKMAEHISSTVTLGQIAEALAQEHRDEGLAQLRDSMVARFCKRST